jgi:predicted RNA-binding protein associated with RNAse of E/G family
MCTPAIVRDSSLYNIDLSLDILVEPDGLSYTLTDEDDFSKICAQGLLTPTEIIGARRGADDLIAIIKRNGLRPFLEEILPFDTVLKMSRRSRHKERA